MSGCDGAALTAVTESRDRRLARRRPAAQTAAACCRRRPPGQTGVPRRRPGPGVGSGALLSPRLRRFDPRARLRWEPAYQLGLMPRPPPRLPCLIDGLVRRLLRCVRANRRLRVASRRRTLRTRRDRSTLSPIEPDVESDVELDSDFDEESDAEPDVESDLELDSDFDEESDADGEDVEPESDGSASATPGVFAIAAPTPSATASAPTRPMYFAVPIVVPSPAKAMQTARAGHR